MLIIRIKINHNGAAVFKRLNPKFRPVHITLICFHSLWRLLRCLWDMVGLSLQQAHFGQMEGKAICSCLCPCRSPSSRQILKGLSSFVSPVSLASSIFVSLHHLLWLPDVPPIPLRGWGWDWSTSRVQGLDTYCNWLSRCLWLGCLFWLSTHTLFFFPSAASLTYSYKLNLMFFSILLFLSYSYLPCSLELILPVNLAFQTRISNSSPWIMRPHHILKNS